MPKDQINCITLKPFNNEVPGWKNSHRIFRECDTYNISWGIDDTGNLYNTNNIKYFANLFKLGNNNFNKQLFNFEYLSKA